MSSEIQYKKIKLKKNNLPSGLKINKNSFSVSRIGNSFYWDDINVCFFRGNYLLDLGDTILPNEANMIVRCFYGKIRIVIPIGIGVFVDYVAYRGTFQIDQKIINIKNQRARYKSPNSDEFPQKIKIFVNSFISTLEIVLA